MRLYVDVFILTRALLLDIIYLYIYVRYMASVFKDVSNLKYFLLNAWQTNHSYCQGESVFSPENTQHKKYTK